MLDFGEGLTVETFKIPWLIWIHIVVLILLIILLYGFSLFPLDLSQEHACSTSTDFPSSSTSPTPVFLRRNSTPANHLQQPYQAGGNRSLKGEIVTGTRSRRIASGEAERGTTSSNTMNGHPCHYFRLAKIAFLKCLGLDCTSEDSSSSSEHKKDR